MISSVEQNEDFLITGIINYLQLLIDSFLKWYMDQIITANLLSLLFVIVLEFLITTIILEIFPFLRTIVNVICFPFRVMHLHAHIQTAKEIERKITETNNLQMQITSPFNEKRTVWLKTVNGGSLSRTDEYSAISFSCTNINDIIKVAMAPMKYAIWLLLIYVAFTPFIIIFGVYGVLFHIYLSISLFGVLMPSQNDYRMIYHTILTAGLLPKKYVIYTYVVYLTFLIDITWRTKNLLIGGMVATLTAFVYLMVIFYCIKKWYNKMYTSIPMLIITPKKGLKQVITNQSDYEIISSELGYS